MTIVRETPFPLLRNMARRSLSGPRPAKASTCAVTSSTDALWMKGLSLRRAIKRSCADVRCRGQLVLISTPTGKRGLVFRELQRGLAGDPRVYAQTGSTFENPNVDHGYIQSLRERMMASAWQREVEGIYTDDDAAVYGWQHIQAAYEGANWVLPLQPDPKRRWVAGWDLAKSEDHTVAYVLDAT